MKKHFLLVIFVIAAMMAAAFPIMGSAADDYKVIKKAVKGKKGGEITFFKLTVFDKKAKKDKVSIKVPFALVEVLAEGEDDLKIKDKDCDVDLKKVLEILKKSGANSLIEIDTEDVLVKIWVE